MHGSKVLVDSIATKNHNRVGTCSYLLNQLSLIFSTIKYSKLRSKIYKAFYKAEDLGF